MNYEWMWMELTRCMKDSIENGDELPTTEWLYEMMAIEEVAAMVED